ncbi:MAG: hypothetical protein IT195_08250 [Microthrixaceae bacterium]|nr:hypothetical protein [Microthrixaceae bacterium]
MTATLRPRSLRLELASQRRRAHGRARAIRAMQRRRAWHYGWPIGVLSIGMPVLFLLGLQGLAWVLPCVGFGVAIVARPEMRLPTGAGWLLLLVGWTLLGGIQLRGAGTVMLFLYRWSLWAGAFACLMWLANVPERLLPSERVEAWLAALWITMMVLGTVAVFAPLDIASPTQYLLGSIGRVPFVDDISRWRMAEVQRVGSFLLPRPSAPFARTNGWGAATGLLMPFFIKVWLVKASGRRRIIGIGILALGLLPMAFSVNRGMLVSVAVALGYLGVRRSLRGNVRALVTVLVGAAVVGVILVATPAAVVIQDRLTKVEDSNDTRGDIYRLAFERSFDSPFIGHGAPRRIPNSPLPPIGTHGLIWYLMFVHGWPALIFFLMWLGGEVVRSARIRAPDDWWAHLSLVIAGIQIVFYGLLPQIILIGIAAGLARRNVARSQSALSGADIDQVQQEAAPA